ncbi:MAG: acetylxylan esterase [Candidatus Latescibacteria bacterium]|nr:acetylxylan esterase [Candidatus Latescibacterota bacterium]
MLAREDVYQSRFDFFDSSQGGGTSLLMGSLQSGRGAQGVCADVPYLTDYRLMYDQGVRGTYATPIDVMSTTEGTEEEWRALGFVDTICHAHRLTMPVLLTAGSEDEVTPPVSVESLFDQLPGTRSYTLLAGQDHTYTMPFIHLASAWFKLYV